MHGPICLLIVTDITSDCNCISISVRNKKIFIRVALAPFQTSPEYIFFKMHFRDLFSVIFLGCFFIKFIEQTFQIKLKRGNIASIPLYFTSLFQIFIEICGYMITEKCVLSSYFPINFVLVCTIFYKIDIGY